MVVSGTTLSSVTMATAARTRRAAGSEREVVMQGVQIGVQPVVERGETEKRAMHSLVLRSSIRIHGVCVETVVLRRV
jgi:hypothetical protein